MQNREPMNLDNVISTAHRHLQDAELIIALSRALSEALQKIEGLEAHEKSQDLKSKYDGEGPE